MHVLSQTQTQTRARVREYTYPIRTKEHAFELSRMELYTECECGELEKFIQKSIVSITLHYTVRNNNNTRTIFDFNSVRCVVCNRMSRGKLHVSFIQYNTIHYASVPLMPYLIGLHFDRKLFVYTVHSRPRARALYTNNKNCSVQLPCSDVSGANIQLNILQNYIEKQ